MKGLGAAVLFLLFPLLTACAASVDQKGGAGKANMLDNVALHASVDEEDKIWELELVNTADKPLQLSFRSGQEIDVVIRKDKASAPVYQYAAEHMFSQALKQVTIDPASSKTWDGDISHVPLANGTYTAVFKVVADAVNGEKLKSPLQTTTSFIVDE
ncbi:Intracellular proteinase inhibitor [Alteribacillus persepolensis]|uniref:Intracellular proteinase inhibitor n=1 Tax=Alteribacillus persepolensis TaxID=568899 RepID=A0A1G8H429_9BACI|nr:BsuPI-related putative proteinase inhibitor [Alteribacillus persepolensis]SDI01363.1 Intracellular proteinase inhibitor [Alteribacillus persepolensis]